MPTIEQIRSIVGKIPDPEVNQDLLTLNMLRDITVEGDQVSIQVELTVPGYTHENELIRRIKASVKSLPGVGEVDVAVHGRVTRARPATVQQTLKGVKNIVAVYACKGGVGKSTVSTNLATALQAQGKKVGILDADIHGPNIPLLMGIQDNPKGTKDNKLIPLESHGVKLMSLGFLTNTKLPSIWRGPMVHGAIQQLLRDTMWGELDFLIVDLPPGTGDAQLTVIQSTPLRGVLFVTTPQELSWVDGIKGINMFRKMKVPILGLIENMAGFECPECHHITNIFSQGNSQSKGKENNIPYLGSIPLDPRVVQGGDAGRPITVSEPQSKTARAFFDIASKISGKLT